MKPPQPWSHRSNQTLVRCPVFEVGRTLALSPHTGEEHTFYRIDAADWVNVVALTGEDEIVMVRQFRHGSRAVTLEIPGGIVDPGESPAQAGARELLEETGYRGAAPEPLGVVNPNPALFGNRCHSFFVPDAKRVAEIQNGPTEETVVTRVPRAELHQRLAAGEIQHALVVAALYWFELRQRA